MKVRVLAFCSVLLATPVSAQETFEARASNLAGLSRIFGELHHIRRMCDPDREGDVWRDRMKRLIDLEQPSFDLRERLVRAFNEGYTLAQDRFSYCDNDAEDYAAARASVGEALVSNLTAPLYSAERGFDDPSVVVVRGEAQ